MFKQPVNEHFTTDANRYVSRKEVYIIDRQRTADGESAAGNKREQFKLQVFKHA